MDSNVISSTVRPMPNDPRERFVANFNDAIAKLGECMEKDIPASMLVLFAYMDSNEGDEAHADHTVFGDDRMHMENIAQLLFQFIDRGTPAHHRAMMQLITACIQKLAAKE